MENTSEHPLNHKVYHRASAPESEQRKGKKSPPSDSDSHPCSESSSPPTMLEVLGEHLYIKIEEMQELFRVELDVARITGILLELGEQQVLRLLQDEALLEQSVRRVVQHVPGVCTALGQPTRDAENEKDDSDTDLDDEERLYDQVCQLEPDLGTQITGMLLEMGGSQVKSLLQSPTKLSEAVHQAKAACDQHNQSPQHHSPRAQDQSMVDELGHKSANTAYNFESMVGAMDQNGKSLKGEREQCYSESMVAENDQRHGETVDGDMSEEDVGELVYSEAVRLYPESAAKLTGIVLDMGKARVLKLLQDTMHLHKAIHLAYRSMSHAGR